MGTSRDRRAYFDSHELLAVRTVLYIHWHIEHIHCTSQLYLEDSHIRDTKHQRLEGLEIYVNVVAACYKQAKRIWLSFFIPPASVEEGV